MVIAGEPGQTNWAQRTHVDVGQAADTVQPEQWQGDAAGQLPVDVGEHTVVPHAHGGQVAPALTDEADGGQSS